MRLWTSNKRTCTAVAYAYYDGQRFAAEAAVTDQVGNSQALRDVEHQVRQQIEDYKLKAEDSLRKEREEQQEEYDKAVKTWQVECKRCPFCKSLNSVEKRDRVCASSDYWPTISDTSPYRECKDCGNQFEIPEKPLSPYVYLRNSYYDPDIQIDIEYRKTA